MKLTIELEKGMECYIVAYCPALKGCVTQARTEEETIENIKEAIPQLHIFRQLYAANFQESTADF